MPDFLEVLETFRPSEASTSRLFGGEGRNISADVRTRQEQELKEAYNNRLLEVTETLTNYLERGSYRDEFALRETMSTADFPYIFGDVIDRMLLSGYREAPQSYRSYCRIRNVRDFRTANAFALDGAEGYLASVAQGAPYPDASLSESRYQASVSKHGRKIPMFWEMIVNDDLGAFNDVVARLGRAARRSEEREAAGKFVGTAGINTSLYKAANKNLVTTTYGADNDNPTLSTAGVNDGLQVLSKMLDADDEPIDMVTGTVHLVVGATLKTTMDQILATQEFRVTDPSGETRIIKGTGLGGNIQGHVNPYINTLASSNGDTAWFLFADPADSRAAIQMLFLRGHQEPEIFVKEPNARRVGGGAINPLDGDFDNDAIEYKVRHCYGSGLLDGKTTVASNGSAS